MKLNFLRSVSCHLQPVMESAGIYKHNKHHVQTLYQHKHHKNIIQKKILSTAYINTHHIISYKIYHIREDINGKKTFSFGHCPNDGGGLPMPEFFGPFFHHVFPYILTSISCYFLVIFNTKIIKSIKIMITIITPIIVVIIVTWFCNTR